MSYLQFISSPCQNRRMAECSSPESQELCLEITVLESCDRRMFGNKNSFSCQSNFVFCCHKIHPRPYRGLPQASHGIIVLLTKIQHLYVSCSILIILWLFYGRKNIMMQRTTNKNAPCLISRICTRFLEAKIERRANTDAGLILRRKLKGAMT